jgi:hypothetical protein
MANQETILSDAVWTEAAGVLGVCGADTAVREAIGTLISRIIEDTGRPPRSRPRQVRNELADLRRDARRLIGRLARIVGTAQPGGNLDGAVAFRLCVASPTRLTPQRLGWLALDLEVLADAAERAGLAIPPDPGGPQAEIELHLLLEKLKGLFEAVTGRWASVTWNAYDERYGGAFFASSRRSSALSPRPIISRAGAIRLSARC